MENISRTKKLILGAVIAVVLVLAGYLTWQKIQENKVNNQVAEEEANIILFYGEECPHCKDVDKYIADNQIDQKVHFSRLEVWHDKSNANLLAEKAKECGIKTTEVGVPFLWAYDKCYIGVNEVENFLNSEAKK